MRRRLGSEVGQIRIDEKRLEMSDWVKKIEAEAKVLFAEAEEELTVLEGVDTIDPLADEDNTA